MNELSTILKVGFSIHLVLWNSECDVLIEITIFNKCQLNASTHICEETIVSTARVENNNVSTPHLIWCIMSMEISEGKGDWVKWLLSFIWKNISDHIIQKQMIYFFKYPHKIYKSHLTLDHREKKQCITKWRNNTNFLKFF